MMELAGQCLVLLAVLETGLRWRWPVAGASLVLAAFAAGRAAETGSWPTAVAALLVSSAAGRRALAARPAPAMVQAGLALGCAALTVPALGLLPVSPGAGVLAAVAPLAACGLVLLWRGDPAGGAAGLVRAGLFASLSGGAAGPAVLPLAVALPLLAAWQARWWPGRATRIVPWLGHRPLATCAAIAGSSVAVAPVPATVGVAALAMAGAAVHLLCGWRRPVPACVAGLALAALGAGLAGEGPTALGAPLRMCGLALHAAGLLRIGRSWPVPSLLAVLVMDASLWSVRDAAPGVLLPAGLAVASWAALVPAGRLARGRATQAAMAHGGIVLAGFGLGTAAGSFAALVHMAGHALAQAGLVLAPRHPWPAVLALAGLPPAALFVSEYLLLRAAPGAFWPLAAVLALVALAILRGAAPGHPGDGTGDGRAWLAWTSLAASAVLGAVAWTLAP